MTRAMISLDEMMQGVDVSDTDGEFAGGYSEDLDGVEAAPQGTIFSILKGIVDGWDLMAVRVKQHGRLQFITLGAVEDQTLLLKVVRDLIRQAAAEQGIRLRKGRGL